MIHAPESQFASYFDGLESFPLTEVEAARIMDVNPDALTAFINRGLITKSVRCKIRKSQALSFFNFYDIFRMELIKKLHVSALAENMVLASLLDELLDEFMLQIDQALSGHSKFSIKDMIDILELHFEERQSFWRECWLLEGEKMVPSKAAHICVRVWIETFNITASQIAEFGLRVSTPSRISLTVPK